MQKDPFRTVVQISRSQNLINVDSSVLFIGSCFADNVGNKMAEARFSTMVNPYGVLYNPLSVASSLDAMIDRSLITQEDLVERDGLWHSFMHHGRFSHSDLNTVVNNINNATKRANSFLKDIEYLAVTFGTAYVYEHKMEQRVVANCHKFPESDFNRYLLEPDEIIDIWKDLIVRLRIFNPSIKIIFTVSPVRHLRDGAHGNQVSKSVLFLALDKLVNLFSKVNYFPAYEIVMDELRDYRFYDQAMTHPNQVAIDYIWQRFTQTQLSGEAQNFVKEISRITKARSHRPIGNNTDAYISFVQQTLDKIHFLSRRYPSVDLEDDLLWFQDILDR